MTIDLSSSSELCSLSLKESLFGFVFINSLQPNDAMSICQKNSCFILIKHHSDHTCNPFNEVFIFSKSFFIGSFLVSQSKWKTDQRPTKTKRENHTVKEFHIWHIRSTLFREYIKLDTFYVVQNSQLSPQVQVQVISLQSIDKMDLSNNAAAAAM